MNPVNPLRETHGAGVAVQVVVLSIASYDCSFLVWITGDYGLGAPGAERSKVSVVAGLANTALALHQELFALQTLSTLITPGVRFLL